MEIAGSDGPRTIKAHPECVFIATANIGLEYTGTVPLDKAIKDRFQLIEIDYMTKDIEAEVLVKRCGITLEYAKKVAELAEITRRKAGAEELSTAISHRHTLDIGYMIADGFSLRQSLESVLPVFEKGMN